mmetsp:Transcript_8515/g.28998  ORF Transcript_8515/g.28998 Transcript_8515/m.28998 type:complete len:213 (+) Transcript_8515:32-670(+)
MSRLGRRCGSRSSRTKMSLPSSSELLSSAMARRAPSGVSNSTMPQPLLRPVSSRIMSACTTVPTCRKWSLRSCHSVLHGALPTKTRVNSPSAAGAAAAAGTGGAAACGTSASPSPSSPPTSPTAGGSCGGCSSYAGAEYSWPYAKPPRPPPMAPGAGPPGKGATNVWPMAPKPAASACRAVCSSITPPMTGAMASGGTSSPMGAGMYAPGGA